MDLTILHHNASPDERITIQPASDLVLNYGPFGVKVSRLVPGFMITASGGAPFVHVVPGAKSGDLFRVTLDPLNVPHVDVTAAKRKSVVATANGSKKNSGTKAVAHVDKKPSGNTEKKGDNKTEKRKASEGASSSVEQPKAKKPKVEKAALKEVTPAEVAALFFNFKDAPAVPRDTKKEDAEATRKREEKNRKRREKAATERALAERQIAQDAHLARLLNTTLNEASPKTAVASTLDLMQFDSLSD
jgi:hypothetical protein